MVEDDDPPPRSWELTNAFLNLTFTSLVDLSGAPAGLPRLYVAERFGYIHRFDNDLQVEGTAPYLDIENRVLEDGETGGLRGFVFHPEWASNGEIFVHYVADNPRRSVISRFRNAVGTSDLIDASSEEVLLEIEQAAGARVGGRLRFGMDGYLYVALADGGSSDDDGFRAQDPSTLHGSILRIDVSRTDVGLAYGIPDDNPLRGNAQGYREEVFAWGFRDPSGIAFDTAGSWLWVTDRGSTLFDEVNIVRSGANYGWPVVEARTCHMPSTGCDTSGLTPPIFEYGGSGIPRGITGGFVYRGTRNPEFQGRYLMADGHSGQVWAIDFDGTNGLAQRLALGEPGFIGIGLDEGLEPLFANALDGRIYRFVWTAP